MRLLATPRETAQELEHSRPLPPGGGERVTGYGALALPFERGDILAFRRLVASSIGPPYSAVWHRDPDGRWTFYVDIEPERSCARYLSAHVERVVVTEIRIAWSAAAELGVSVPAARVDLSLRLGASPATHLLNAMLRLLPERAWASRRAHEAIGALAGSAPDAGSVRFRGITPNGRILQLAPRQIWRIIAGIAVVHGRELGPMGALPRQAELGEYLLPNAGLFAFGSGRFESRDRAGPRRGEENQEASWT